MRLRLFLALLLIGGFLLAAEPRELNPQQQATLADLSKDFALAQTEFELAKARLENIQMKYELTLIKIRRELGLSEDYQYEPQTGKFVPQVEETK